MANNRYQQVVSNIAQLANREKYDFDFIYEFLAAYGIPKATITRLKTGETNRVKDIPNAVLQKDVVYFRVFPLGTMLENKVHEMDDETICGKYRPRFIIASDLKRMVALDNKKRVLPLSVDLKDIDSTQSIDFFFGWTGDEIDTSGHSESEMDRRAAENINKIYAEIEKKNIDEFTTHPREFRHSLNVFFTRLLFCLFAEDTGLFEKGQFTDSIKKYTMPDGSDLDEFLENLFAALDAEDKSAFPHPFDEFPYVDGTIFDTSKHDIIVPKFNGEARRLILEYSNLDWGSINPDIFGTIFQGVVDPSRRDESGMDYTSVSNILKIINPLFLNELHDEFDKAYDDKNKLWKLLNRMGDIKVFDPACGSGNFLVIAYKELRDLECDIWARLLELGAFMQDMRFKSTIQLGHFYGIEIDDFAHELAVLSMTIAQRQCDMIFEKRFGKEIKMLPLVDVPTIRCANSARIDWQEVCPNVPHPKKIKKQGRAGFGATVLDALNIFGEHEKKENSTEMEYDEIYVIGNPPYKGAKYQSPSQKSDFEYYFKNENYSKNLDYVALWFIKGARYIKGTSASLAFVSTNSICQGEHVSLMFPKIFDEGIEISFAYTSFKWQNNAKDNAGVIVIILGLRNESDSPKFLITDGIASKVKNINARLEERDAPIVNKASKPLNGLPAMYFGSQAIGSEYLTFDEKEKDVITLSGGGKFIKKFVGSSESLRGNSRYCLWIKDSEVAEAKRNEIIWNRIERVRESRLKAKSAATRKSASRPWAFTSNRYNERPTLLIPRVSSGKREYIPMSFQDKDTVIPDSAVFIEDPELYIFALLESKMHMVWISSVCGKLKNDYRYSSSLGYNTFPINPLSEQQKKDLTESAKNILVTREKHTDLTLGEMYNTDTMPSDLKMAHEQNDILVDQLYQKKGFVDDEERLALLFELYEKMIENEKTNGKA